MSKVSENIYSTLRTKFLIDGKAARNWKIIILVVFLLLIMITSGHKIDSKVIKISELNKKKRELRAKYIDTQTILMRMKMESNVMHKVKLRGVFPSKTSPQKIKIINKKK